MPGRPGAGALARGRRYKLIRVLRPEPLWSHADGLYSCENSRAFQRCERRARHVGGFLFAVFQAGIILLRSAANTSGLPAGPGLRKAVAREYLGLLVYSVLTVVLALAAQSDEHSYSFTRSRSS